MSGEADALNTLDAELDQLNARIPRLYEFLEDGIYDRAIFRSRMDELERRRQQLSARQEEITSQIRRKQSENQKAAADELAHVLEAYSSLSPGEKNRTLKSVLDQIIYTKPKKSGQRDFNLLIVPRHFIW